MSLRVAFDLDGTIADLSSAYHALERQLFGKATASQPDDADGERADDNAAEALVAEARIRRRQQDAVWKALKDTNDFWTTLAPIEAGVIARIHAMSRERGWEVFFITQRPATVGRPVQAQTQEWLVAQGFPLPSVLTLSGSRGKAVHALDLDFLVDDLPRNCVDVLADSRCRPILVARDLDATSVAAAKRMRVPVVTSVAAALDVLTEAGSEHRKNLVGQILRRLGL